MFVNHNNLFFNKPGIRVFKHPTSYLCQKWPQICSTCHKHFRSFPNSWFITGFVTRLTRKVPLVRQEMPTLPEHPISPPGFVLLDIYFMCMLCRSLFVLLASVLLQYTDSDYPFGIFKLFFLYSPNIHFNHDLCILYILCKTCGFPCGRVLISIHWCSLCSQLLIEYGYIPYNKLSILHIFQKSLHLV